MAMITAKMIMDQNSERSRIEKRVQLAWASVREHGSHIYSLMAPSRAYRGCSQRQADELIRVAQVSGFASGRVHGAITQPELKS